MQAIFRFNGSEEIEVWRDHVGVYITKRLQETSGCHHSGETQEEMDAHAKRISESNVTIGLSKSGARSIASALMQAAAEL